MTVDTSGNLFIADTGNNRVRKVTPDGVISTVAGTGQTGFDGEGVLATMAQLAGPKGLAADVSGNIFIAEPDNNRIRKVTFTQQALFSIVDRGGISLRSSGMSPATTAGYASIQPNSASTTPAGLAIFGYRQKGVLVTEAGVPASPLLLSGRIYSEVNGPINISLALANPNSQDAVIAFSFTDAKGNSTAGTTTVPANRQIAAFLNQSPFNTPAPSSGAFTFTSSVSVAVIALRGRTNERGEFLITTLPVADLSASVTTDSVVFPHFVDGAGWTTQIVLVNPSDTILMGVAQFRSQSGTALTLTANGQSSDTFAYSIPARSAFSLQTSGLAPAVTAGSVRVVPAAGSAAPSGTVIFAYRNGDITVSEAGVPAVPPGTIFRLYAEASGSLGVPGSIQTGIAVTNLSANPAAVVVEITKLDGSSIGLTGTLTIPGNGQTAAFLNDVQGLSSLQTPFQGILRVSGVDPISVVGLRGRYNERTEFLMTTTQPINEAASTSATLFFPHIVDSGGFTTQFILFSARPGQSSSATIQFFSQSGGAWSAAFQ
jgi:hypothetical protein